MAKTPFIQYSDDQPSPTSITSSSSSHGRRMAKDAALESAMPQGVLRSTFRGVLALGLAAAMCLMAFVLARAWSDRRGDDVRLSQLDFDGGRGGDGRAPSSPDEGASSPGGRGRPETVLEQGDGPGRAGRGSGERGGEPRNEKEGGGNSGLEASPPPGVLVEKWRPNGLKHAVCRIYNPCVLLTKDNPRLVLPPGFSARGAKARDACALGQAISADDPMARASTTVHVRHHDLFMGMGSDFHFPHWLAHSSPLFDMVDILYGDRVRVGYERVCERDTPDAACAQSRPATADLVEGINPVVLVHPWADSPSSWIYKILGAIHDTIVGGDKPRLLHYDAMVAKDTQVCFRSAVLPLQNGYLRPMLPMSGHVVFKHNQWNKEPRAALCDRKRVQVTVLTRKTTRKITNEAEVVRATQQVLEKTFHEVVVNLVTFENATFEEQVAVMQETDVLVAAHGAAIANAVFMKKYSLLLEIFPFAYTVEMFQHMSVFFFDIKRAFIMAPPDMDKVIEMLELQAEKNPPVTKSVEEYREMYKRIAKTLWRPGPQDKFADFTNADTHFLEYDAFGRRPLKWQDLFADPTLVQDRLRNWTETLCT